MGDGKKAWKRRRGADGVGRETGYCVDCGRDITKRRDEGLMCERCELLKYSGVWEKKMGRIDE